VEYVPAGHVIHWWLEPILVPAGQGAWQVLGTSLYVCDAPSVVATTVAGLAATPVAQYVACTIQTYAVNADDWEITLPLVTAVLSPFSVVEYSRL